MCDIVDLERHKKACIPRLAFTSRYCARVIAKSHVKAERRRFAVDVLIATVLLMNYLRRPKPGLDCVQCARLSLIFARQKRSLSYELFSFFTSQLDLQFSVHVRVRSWKDESI